MRRRPWHLLAVLACAAVALGPRAAAAAEDPCAPRLRAALNVGTRGSPLVTLTVNGRPAHLLLDTGAERTTLTEAAARRLGLLVDFDHARTMRGVGGNVEAAEVQPDLVSAGGHKLSGFKFAVVPVHLPPVGEQEVDGLLGADMLGAYDLDINIGHHLILLYDPPRCAAPTLPWTRDYDAVDARLSRHLHVAFPITLDGHKLTAFIDTGAQVSLIDADASSKLGVTQAALVNDTPVMMQGVSSEVVTAREHRFGRLGLADEVLLSPTVAVLPLRLDDAQLLMGTDVLMRERIWLSYATRRIYVARPE